MFSVTLLRVLRPRVVTLASIQLTTAAAAARHGAQISASCWRLSRRTQTHAVRRSFLQTDDQVQSQCSFSRCLSTAAHSIDGNLIYTGSLGSAIRGVKLFSYSSSGASLLLMPQILLKTGLGVQTFALQAAFCGVIGFFTFITPVLLHLLTKGYVIRLYHNPVRDTYTAITYSVLLTEKKSVFHQSEVKVPAVSGMFTTFYAGHTGLLVNPELFPIPHDYNHLMGYDKPFSFDPDDKNNPDDS